MNAAWWRTTPESARGGPDPPYTSPLERVRELRESRTWPPLVRSGAIQQRARRLQTARGQRVRAALAHVPP